MLPGLSALELGRIRISVGYGSNKKGRLLSPLDIARLLRTAIRHGATRAECAEEIRLNPTGVARFLRLLDLPEDLQHLIDWGSGTDFVGFSATAGLLTLDSSEDQRALALATMAHRLTSKEVGQVAQLRRRSGRTIESCAREVLGMRPQVERRYVFLGSVPPESVNALRQLTQPARNAILARALEGIGIQHGTGRLGDRFFTLVGGERFNASMQAFGKARIETQLQLHISQAI